MLPQPSIGIHSVLYHADAEALERSLEALHRAAEYGWAESATGPIHVRYGDCSPVPVLSEERLAEWRVQFPSLAEISVEFFGENLGHGGAQNRLAATAVTDRIVIANPDVVVGARTLSRLAATLDDPTVGIVEAKQLPLEHPKDYDRSTGVTSWCSGAFAMVRAADFHAVGGFDHESFFMYCDDVDLSWRIRTTGRNAVIQPAAIAFHDKRLSRAGGWVPTASERFYSVEGALFLAYKWSRDDIVASISDAIDANGDEIERRALRSFSDRVDAGAVPQRFDAARQTGDFTAGNYGPHRFAV